MITRNSFKFLSFVKARNIARKLNLPSELKWREYSKSINRPPTVPSHPEDTYKNKGWVSWGDWLGTNNLKGRGKSWPSFKKAYKQSKKYINELNIDSISKWNKHISSDLRLLYNLPSDPSKTYKNNGWISWNHWLNTSRHQFNRKYRVNEDFFKKWSYDMAYILGFWFADGFISYGKNRGYLFSIFQHENEKYLLIKMLKKMGSDCPIYKDDKYIKISIYSKKIVEDIIRIGGKERKSLDVKFPDIPKKYLPDFVRGLWDGDGCITRNKKEDRYVCSLVSGSKEFIYSLHAELSKNIKGLKGSIFESKNKRVHFLYVLSFSSNDTIRLREYMYGSPSNLRMERKYNRFLMAKSKRNFLPIEKAKFSIKKDIKRFKITNENLWRKYCTSGHKPKNIPSGVVQYYKNKGWESWMDWLGIKMV
jgi:hypothetical protein